MNNLFKPLAFLLLFACFTAAGTADAQNRQYQLANTLMQQQKYDEALPILQELHNENPGAFVFFDKLTETLVNLDRTEEAIEIAEQQVERNRARTQAQTRLAELYHINGQKENAIEQWEEVVERNKDQIQSYFTVASSMQQRREFSLAIDLYHRAREQFNNPTLFQSELANTYMQAGRFDEAVNSYFQLVKHTPDQMSFVQQRLLRMRDQELYQVAALELEDFMMEMETDHAAYQQLYQLLSWLLLETEDYRRAFVFARRYENQTSRVNYSLYSLASRLQSARQYELAADAFRYYMEEETSMKSRATEELAQTYNSWARYLEQTGLETQARQLELFEKAYELNRTLIEDAPNYNRLERVLSAQTDLALDVFKNPEDAKKWAEMIRQLNGDERSAYSWYAEGRIALFEKDFTTARQALTRADRATDDSNLSEKARYFLSLSDFYAGDYEFAEIQLRSLERRNTSYYANDAIKLRMWIKNGLRSDTTGSTLQALGQGMHYMHTGSYDEAINIFEPFLATHNHPFTDDITVELAVHLPERYKKTVYALLSSKVSRMSYSPLLERMMWERARAAEKIIKTDGLLPPDERFADPDMSFVFSETDVEELFEDILIEFPGGFYARYVRDMLQRTAIPTL